MLTVRYYFEFGFTSGRIKGAGGVMRYVKSSMNAKDPHLPFTYPANILEIREEIEEKVTEKIKNIKGSRPLEPVTLELKMVIYCGYLSG